MAQNKKNNIHVVGIGTIGEPLLRLFLEQKKLLGFDRISFSKRSARESERPKINGLIERGAVFAATADSFKDFEKIGIKPGLNLDQAYEEAKVIVDCTSAGNQNKADIYSKLENKVNGFIAQGSEENFGRPYAFNITDKALKKDDKYIWVVSCNTHNLSVIVNTIALNNGKEKPNALVKGDFSLFRRATDTSQQEGFIPGPEISGHDCEFGTHQAEDAATLFKKNFGWNLNLFSSAAKLNTQYMHIMRFSLTLKKKVTKDEVLKRINANPLVALTHKNSTAEVFSFGRDQGHCGRILNQTVIPVKGLFVKDNQVTGFCFTPQDGNSLLSSTAATLFLINPKTYKKTMQQLIRPPFVFSEV